MPWVASRLRRLPLRRLTMLPFTMSCITARFIIDRHRVIVWCITRFITDTVDRQENKTPAFAGVLFGNVEGAYSTSRNERNCSERLG